MNTKQQAITAVLRRRGKTNYGEISNTELLGVEPKNDLERAGVGQLAGGMRNDINDILESEYGIGLVPNGHDGSHLIVPLDQRAAYVLHGRMKKVARLLTDYDGARSNLKATVRQFQHNPHLGQEMISVFRKAENTMRAFEILAEEAIIPKLGRLESLLVRHVPSIDDEEDAA